MPYTQLVDSDVNGMTVAQLIQVLKRCPHNSMVFTDGGNSVCKVAITIDGEQTYVEIYNEKE